MVIASLKSLLETGHPAGRVLPQSKKEVSCA